MFGTLRRNKTWLWGIIIIVVIISFVIFFSPDVNFNQPVPGAATAAYMDGKPVTGAVLQRAYDEARISYFLSNGQMPQNSREWNGEMQAKQRLFLKDRAQKQGIVVSPEAVAAWMRNLPYFKGKDGEFSSDIYERVMANFNRMGISKRDLEEYGASEMAIKQLMVSVAMPGMMVSPRLAEASLDRNKERLLLELAAFRMTNYLDQVTVNETNVAKFFTNRLATYRVPEKIQVNYVKFESTNYVAQAIAAFEKKQGMTLQEMIDKTYAEAGADAYLDEDGKQMSEADAKAKLRTETERIRSLYEARTVAAEFVNRYYAAEKFTKEDFMQAAKEAGYTVETSAPFSVSEAPEGLDLTSSFSREAFNLSVTNAVLIPMVGKTNVYAVCLDTRVAGYAPKFEDIEAKVQTDYKEYEARTLSRTAGRNFATTLTNILASGKSFEDACKEANAELIKLPVVTVDTTEVEEELPVSWMQIKNSVSLIPAGKASSLIAGADAGVVAYVKERNPADPQVVKDTLKEFTEDLVYENMSSVFQEWFSVEYAKADVKTTNDIYEEQKKAEEAAAKAAAEAAATNNVAPTTNDAPTAAPTVPTTPVATPAAPAAAAPAAATPAAPAEKTEPAK